MFWKILLSIGLILVSIPAAIFVFMFLHTNSVEDAGLVASWPAFFLLPPGMFIVLGCTWRAIVHRMDRFMDEHP